MIETEFHLNDDATLTRLLVEFEKVVRANEVATWMGEPEDNPEERSEACRRTEEEVKHMRIRLINYLARKYRV